MSNSCHVEPPVILSEAKDLLETGAAATLAINHLQQRGLIGVARSNKHNGAETWAISLTDAGLQFCIQSFDEDDLKKPIEDPIRDAINTYYLTR